MPFHRTSIRLYFFKFSEIAVQHEDLKPRNYGHTIWAEIQVDPERVHNKALELTYSCIVRTGGIFKSKNVDV